MKGEERGGPQALSTPLEGGASTAVNIIFFKRQTEHFFAHRSHLPQWEELGEFQALQQHMRDAAVTYLALHGCPEDEARELAKGDLMIWASVHRAGSCHPPHVHSDSMVTGTYYVRAV